MWPRKTIYFVLLLVATTQVASARDLLASTLQFITGDDGTVTIDSSNLSALPSDTAPDLVTETCLRCHDGSVTNRVTSHPVGIDYDKRVREQPGEYRPRTALDPDIHLVNGKVSCISCHRLTRDMPPEESMGRTLVAENDICPSSKMLYPLTGRRDLCLSCHIK